jgi:serine/threonine protein kinase
MTSYYIINSGQRQKIQLQTPRIGGGGEADIFRVIDFAGCVAKVYLSQQSKSHASREKLQAMLKRPPQNMWTNVLGRNLPIFAWPTHLMEDDQGKFVGFLMPEIPLDRAVTLEKYMSRISMRRVLSLEDRSLPRRIHVCRNLAATIAEMHRQNHYFVDLKPQNILMFKDTGVVTLVDNDSFSISGEGNNPRFPAAVMSSEYFAPELLRNGMGAASIVNDFQDRFALAAMIFQIFNNGVHPFSGTPTVQTDEGTIDSRIKLGLYPYGLSPNPAIKPTISSIHDCWETTTRTLFDRAFTAQPSQRPSAEEWRNHLDKLGSPQGSIKKCIVKPDDILHLHFAGRPCAECRMDELDGATGSGVAGKSGGAGTVSTGSVINMGMGNSSGSISGLGGGAGSGTSTGGTGASGGTGGSNNKPWLYWVLAAIIAAVIYYFATESRLQSSVQVPVNVGEIQNTPASTTPIATINTANEVQMVTNSNVASKEKENLSTAQSTAAKNLMVPDDAVGISARMEGISSAISKAVEENKVDLMAVIQLGNAGDDKRTLEAAQKLMRQTAFVEQFDGWLSLRKYARPMTEALSQNSTYRSDLNRANIVQAKALALDPRDREIAGNLAFYQALNQKFDSAMGLAVYSLSLPRDVNRTGRPADWQLVASMLALKGFEKESQGAFFVGLAISGNLTGFCKSLLAQQADFGEKLKAPIDTVFQRIASRGQSDTDGCAYPPVWL